MSDYLSQLNDVQRKAVENYKSPSLIIAGAGSGKTRVLTYRIAHMIYQGVPPSQILALTFTNKAAAEMRARIQTIVPPPAASGLWMGTFHSMFSRILRAEAETLGFSKSFTIYETSDSRNLVKTIVKEMNLNEEKYKPNQIYGRISLAKNNLVIPQAYQANATLTTEDATAGRPRFGEIYAEYMQRCRRNGAMDFDDLILYTNILFRDHPGILLKYQEQFRYVLVDEYQDTNYAQYLIVKRLTEKYRNICVVGDDAQSIYSFRGARIENILKFKEDYPEANVYKLEQNYRSTQTIVNAANDIIAKNQNRLRKTVFSANEIGDKIVLSRTYTEKEEALTIANDIRHRVQESQGKTAYSDIAVLYRTNAQSQPIEEALRNRNIPYRIYGGTSFYQRREIKHVLAYARLVVNPNDDEAFSRIINVPARGIGQTSIARITAMARQHGVSMWEAIEKFTPEAMEIRGAAVKKIREFMEMIASLRQPLHEKDAYELVYEIANRSGIIGMFKNDGSPESQSAYENIEELINSLKRQTEELKNEGAETIFLDEWLQNVTLITDMDSENRDDPDKVTLMTVHSAKGLEFDYIYIAGMEEGLFPSPRSSESVADLEEERRLFYVAVTRAIKGVVISFALSRYKWGTVIQAIPSRFLKEIDRKYFNAPELLEANRFNSLSEEKHENSNRYGQDREASKPAFAKYENRSATTPGTDSKPPMPPGKFKRIVSGQKTATVEEPVNNTGEISAGVRVIHEKFGEGIVRSLEDTASDKKATVEFATHGTKTLLLKFAKLRVLK